MEQVISVLNPFAIFGDFEFRFAPAFSKSDSVSVISFDPALNTSFINISIMITLNSLVLHLVSSIYYTTHKKYAMCHNASVCNLQEFQ